MENIEKQKKWDKLQSDLDNYWGDIKNQIKKQYNIDNPIVFYHTPEYYEEGVIGVKEYKPVTGIPVTIEMEKYLIENKLATRRSGLFNRICFLEPHEFKVITAIEEFMEIKKYLDTL